MAATAEFRLSIMRALADQLAEGLRDLDPDPLDVKHLAEVDHKPGVYQLYKDGVLVYVGKHESSVANRLREHHDKIACRLNIDLREMSFTALYVHEDLHSVAPEQRLISMYKEQGLAAWNGQGFGPHDPGQRRDETTFGPDHFDSKYPVNLDWVCDKIEPRWYTVAELLARIKGSVPFLFRYQQASFHKELRVTVESPNPTANELFDLLGRAVNDSDARWRITALPGYVIMYPKPGPYPSARMQYPPTPQDGP
jgi:hypothetical protein